jgi:hypothetical protein
MIMVEVTKIWWDGERLMAEPIDSAIMYKNNEVAQPDSTCNKTLRAEGKGYPRTCRKCGKGPCIADRVQPEQEPSCKDCQTESPCRAKGQDLDVCSFYVPPPAAQRQPQYNKTEMNCFVQNLYDQKMREGKRGHYETMFHVVHRAIEAAHGITGENK